MMAQRYLSVIDLLRSAQPAAIVKPYFNAADAVTLRYIDGLALCIACVPVVRAVAIACVTRSRRHDGATSIRDSRRTRRIPTTSAITSTSAQAQLKQLNQLLNSSGGALLGRERRI
jgi:hypothetical protein